MLTFKSLTQQELLNEVVEYIRMRGLQEGLPAHPTFKPTMKRRNQAEDRENVLRRIAQEIENGVIVSKE